MSGSDVVRVELGVSIFEGELIAGALEASGLSVELLHNTHPETGGAFALGTCVLLVARRDEPAVREYLAASGY